MQVSPEIESLVAYVPGKPIEETRRELGLEKIIKLASNENPLGPSPMAVAALKASAEGLGRYPDPRCFGLKKKVGEIWDVPVDNILVGNGSNELIDLLIRVFCEPGDRILMPEKSFVAYGICAQAARVAKKTFPVDENMQLEIASVVDYFKSQSSSRDKIFFLANPNNPTGAYLKAEQVQELLDVIGGRPDILFVMDDAYNEFVRATDFPDSVALQKKYPNVLILKTFSKIYGLAGLRVGALIGATEHLQWIERVRNPFNVNSLAQVAATAALSDTEYLKASRDLVWRGLDQFYAFLQTMGLRFWPSQGNFVLFDSRRDGSELFEALMKKGLLVRPLRGYGLPTHIRLSVGTDAENLEALEILKTTLPKVGEL